MKGIVKSIHKIKDVSTLLRALRMFSYVKNVTIEIHEKRKFVLRVKFPWYYVFPYSIYKRFQIQMELNKIKEPGAKIIVKKF